MNLLPTAPALGFCGRGRSLGLSLLEVFPPNPSPFFRIAMQVRERELTDSCCSDALLVNRRCLDFSYLRFLRWARLFREVSEWRVVYSRKIFVGVWLERSIRCLRKTLFKVVLDDHLASVTCLGHDHASCRLSHFLSC